MFNNITGNKFVLINNKLDISKISQFLKNGSKKNTYYQYLII